MRRAPLLSPSLPFPSRLSLLPFLSLALLAGCASDPTCPAGTTRAGGACIPTDAGDDAPPDAAPDACPLGTQPGSDACCAPETCDGLDNDCDGVIDNGVLSFGAAVPAGNEDARIAGLFPAPDGAFTLAYVDTTSPVRGFTHAGWRLTVAADGTHQAGGARITSLLGAIARAARLGTRVAFFQHTGVSSLLAHGATSDGANDTGVVLNYPAFAVTLGDPGDGTHAYVYEVDDAAITAHDHPLPTLAQSGSGTAVLHGLTGATFPDALPVDGDLDLFLLVAGHVARFSPTGAASKAPLPAGTYTPTDVSLSAARDRVAFTYNAVPDGGGLETVLDLRERDLEPIARGALSAVSAFAAGKPHASAAATEDSVTWFLARSLRLTEDATELLVPTIDRVRVEGDAIVEVDRYTVPCTADLCPPALAGAHRQVRIAVNDGHVLLAVSDPTDGGAFTLPLGCFPH